MEYRLFKSRLQEQKRGTITAVLSYQKGEHLKLIPFFKPSSSNTITGKKNSKQDTIDVCKADPSNGDFYLFEKFQVDVLTAD